MKSTKKVFPTKRLKPIAVRVDDQLHFYQNYNRQADTIYGNEIVNTTNPDDFMSIKHVKKGQGVKQLDKFKNPEKESVSGIRNTMEYPEDMFPRAQTEQASMANVFLPFNPKDF
jgi:hypothetical protein